MNESYASAEECRPLYAVMEQIKEMAPWQWMVESQMFGVQHPNSDQIDFVSVMGQLGEHYAVSVYLGRKGLFDYWAYREAYERMRDDDARAERLLTLPQLMASFEDL